MQSIHTLEHRVHLLPPSMHSAIRKGEVTSMRDSGRTCLPILLGVLLPPTNALLECRCGWGSPKSQDWKTGHTTNGCLSRVCALVIGSCCCCDGEWPGDSCYCSPQSRISEGGAGRSALLLLMLRERKSNHRQRICHRNSSI